RHVRTTIEVRADSAAVVAEAATAFGPAAREIADLGVTRAEAAAGRIAPEIDAGRAAEAVARRDAADLTEQAAERERAAELPSREQAAAAERAAFAGAVRDEVYRDHANVGGVTAEDPARAVDERVSRGAADVRRAAEETGRPAREIAEERYAGA